MFIQLRLYSPSHSPLRVASEEDLYQRHSNNVPSAPSTSSTSAPQHQHHHHFRQLCLVCGRMAKQQQLQQHLPSGGSASQAASFYNIASGLVSPTHPDDPDKATTIGRRLGEILRVELPKKKLVPSEEICKKCFRQLNEIDYLEGQVSSLWLHKVPFLHHLIEASIDTGLFHHFTVEDSKGGHDQQLPQHHLQDRTRRSQRPPATPPFDPPGILGREETSWSPPPSPPSASSSTTSPPQQPRRRVSPASSDAAAQRLGGRGQAPPPPAAPPSPGGRSAPSPPPSAAAL